MKAILLSAAVFMSGFALACGDAESKAYDRAINVFNVGESTRIEVSQAQLAYLGAAKTCNNLSQSRYCYEALTASSVMVDGLKEEITQPEMGYTQKMLDDALAQQKNITDECFPNLKK